MIKLAFGGTDIQAIRCFTENAKSDTDMKRAMDTIHKYHHANPNAKIVVCICHYSWIYLATMVRKNKDFNDVVSFETRNGVNINESIFNRKYIACESDYRELISELQKAVSSFVGNGKEYSRLLFRGQRKEKRKINSGLYRFLTAPDALKKAATELYGKEMAEQYDDLYKMKWDVEKFLKLARVKNEQYSIFYKQYSSLDGFSLIGGHDLQHLGGMTEYIDLTPNKDVAFGFANHRREEGENSRISVFIEKPEFKYYDGIKVQSLSSVWTLDYTSRGVFKVGRKIGYLSKAEGISDIAKMRIEAQDAYFLNYYGDDKSGLSLEYEPDCTFSILSQATYTDEYKLYPDKNPALSEEEKKTFEKYRDIADKIINGVIKEDQDKIAKLIFKGEKHFIVECLVKYFHDSSDE